MGNIDFKYCGIVFPLMRHPNKRATSFEIERVDDPEKILFPLIRHPNKRATCRKNKCRRR